MSEYLDMLNKDYIKYVKKWKDYCMDLSQEEWNLCYNIIMEKSSKPDYTGSQLLIDIFLEKIEKLDKDVKIIDIGCFNGYFLYKLHNSGFRNLYGIDCSEYAIDLARTSLDRGISLKACSIEQIDFDDNYFDVVVCIETLEHLKDVNIACNEIQRILKNGGKAFFSFPKENKVESYCHINYFSRGEKAPDDMKGCINFYDIHDIFDRNVFDINIDTTKDDETWNDRIYIISLTKKPRMNTMNKIAMTVGIDGKKRWSNLCPIESIDIGENFECRGPGIIYEGVKIGSNVRTGHNWMIRENSIIGDGTSIGTGVVIEANCIIGKGCTLQTGVYIPSEAIIGDGVFVGPYAILTNDKYCGIGADRRFIPRIGSYARIGANSTIIANIGVGAFVGGGAVVTKDIEPWTVIAGNPAKVIGKVADDKRSPYWGDEDEILNAEWSE